jgi:alpha-N-acetylglucosamine transferase
VGLGPPPAYCSLRFAPFLFFLQRGQVIMLAVFAQKRVVAITAAFFAIVLLLVSSSHYYYAPPRHGAGINNTPVGNGHVSNVDTAYEQKHDVVAAKPPATVNADKPAKPANEDLLEHMPDGLDNKKPEDNTPRPDVPAAPEAAAGHIVSDEHGNPNNTGKNADGSEKLAYVTFLSGTLDQDEDLEADNYFVAIRILVWQLLHNLETRTKGIDVVVMVTPSVSQSRRERLERDGAIVYPVEFLRSENRWAKAEDHRWDDVMTKLRVWEMTQYSRILVMDGDSMLLHPLDGVFADPGAQLQTTKQTVKYKAPKGIAPLPETYLLASLSEVWDSTHDFPPKDGTGLKKIGYMNAGFFLLAPSIPAFNHYASFLDIPDSFDPKYPEQNLLNQVHAWTGPMPWTELSYTWNIRCPSDIDIEKGVVSVHEKWWTQPYIYNNEKTKKWLLTRRWEMKGFYEAFDRWGRKES